jgi:cyclase
MSIEIRNMSLGALIAGALLLATPMSLAASKEKAAPKGDADMATVEIVPIRDSIFMVSGGGSNMTVQVGDNGILVVDTLPAGLSDKAIAAIRSISDKPIRYIVDTSYRADHVGGNAAIREAGTTVTGGNVAFEISGSAEGAAIIAHEAVLFRLSAPTGEVPAMTEDGWPTSTYFEGGKDVYFNGEAVRVMHIPSAATDGDSIVFFRKSDVISVGDLFQTTTYPVVDLASGGSLQGLIDAETRIIGMMVAEYGESGGTLLIPGHGRAAEMGDIVWYREMLSIIRDRIQARIDQGMTAEQVIAGRPTRDYDGRYAAASGPATAENFVAMAYKSLVAAKSTKKPSGGD